MTKQIYQPVINALNYEKSIIDEIAVGVIQYDISHIINFSTNVSATLVGGHIDFILTEEISQTITPSMQFAYGLESELTQNLSLQPQFINRFEDVLNVSPSLITSVFQYIGLEGTINFSSSVEAEIGYHIDFTKNMSEYVSRETEEKRTHYVWDGGIILR